MTQLANLAKPWQTDRPGQLVERERIQAGADDQTTTTTVVGADPDRRHQLATADSPTPMV